MKVPDAEADRIADDDNRREVHHKALPQTAQCVHRALPTPHHHDDTIIILCITAPLSRSTSPVQRPAFALSRSPAIATSRKRRAKALGQCAAVTTSRSFSPSRRWATPYFLMQQAVLPLPLFLRGSLVFMSRLPPNDRIAIGLLVELPLPDRERRQAAAVSTIARESGEPASGYPR